MTIHVQKSLDIPMKDIIKRYYNDQRSRQALQNNPASIFVFFPLLDIAEE